MPAGNQIGHEICIKIDIQNDNRTIWAKLVLLHCTTSGYCFLPLNNREIALGICKLVYDLYTKFIRNLPIERSLPKTLLIGSNLWNRGFDKPLYESCEICKSFQSPLLHLLWIFHLLKILNIVLEYWTWNIRVTKAISFMRSINSPSLRYAFHWEQKYRHHHWFSHSNLARVWIRFTQKIVSI